MKNKNNLFKNIKKILLTIFFVFLFWNTNNIVVADNSNNVVYKNLIKNIFIEYKKWFDDLGQSTNLNNIKNSGSKEGNNNWNKGKYIKMKLWIWQYQNEIENENLKRRKKISEALNKYILWNINIKIDLDKNLLDSIKKIKRKDAIFVYLKFDTSDYFTFNNIKKTLVLLPYNIKVNWKIKESISIIQQKINKIFNNKNSEKEKFINLKELLSNYGIKYLIFDNIISNNNNNSNIEMYLWEKYSFFTKYNINLFSSSYYKINDLDFIQNKAISNTIKILNKSWDFYIWWITTEKELNNFFKNLWQNNFQRDNLISYFKLNFNNNNIKYVLNWINVDTKNNKLKKENFYTLQFSDKIWWNEIKPQFNYSFIKTYNYIIFMIISILIGVWLAFFIFKLNYNKKIKKILSEWSDKI